MLCRWAYQAPRYTKAPKHTRYIKWNCLWKRYLYNIQCTTKKKKTGKNCAHVSCVVWSLRNKNKTLIEDMEEAKEEETEKKNVDSKSAKKKKEK